MKNRYDPWYLRLPDGRVVKAKSTSSVRHHVDSGNIPLNSMARRESHEEWISLIWIAEFADLGGGARRVTTPATEDPDPLISVGNGEAVDHRTGISARLDPLRLQTVGIRGLVDELIAAFDSAIGAGKGIFACACLAIAMPAIYLAMRGGYLLFPDGDFLIKIVAGVLAGLVVAIVTAVLTRQTHLELSTMRPVRLVEALGGASVFVFRVFVGYVATVGGSIGLIALLQHAPDWLAPAAGGMNPLAAEALRTVVWAVCLFLGAILFTVILLCFLLPPILIVEECSVGDALREWRSLLREHRIRALVYEGLALALAMVAALPLAVPAGFSLYYFPLVTSNWMKPAISIMLMAIVAGPGLTFMAVANLFIYLNLRYEYSPSQ